MDFSYNSDELASSAAAIKQQGEKVQQNLDEMRQILENKLTQEGITGDTAQQIREKFEREYVPQHQEFTEGIDVYGNKTQQVSEASADLTAKNKNIIG